MSQTTDTLFLDQQIPNSLYTFLRGLRDKMTTFYSSPILELLVQVEQAKTAAQLTTAVNRVQKRIWKLAASEQATFRATLLAILSTHTLQAQKDSLRIEAAGWLRLFVQAGFVATPQDVFVTLVTAATRISPKSEAEREEQQAYLTIIFDCFWPFRHPYPAYTWQAFPANEVFYPLATFMSTADEQAQDICISIFGELPTLNDPAIAPHLLPVALQWAYDGDTEKRRRITNILARLDDADAEQALVGLLADTDPVVRENAKSATEFLRRA